MKECMIRTKVGHIMLSKMAYWKMGKKANVLKIIPKFQGPLQLYIILLESKNKKAIKITYLSLSIFYFDTCLFF